MVIYSFLSFVSESASCVYSGQFADDATAIAYLSNLPVGTYQVQKNIQVDASTGYLSIILDQTI